MGAPIRDKYALLQVVKIARNNSNVPDHQFPLHEQQAMWEQRNTRWSFFEQELQYNGIGFNMPSGCLNAGRKAL